MEKNNSMTCTIQTEGNESKRIAMYVIYDKDGILDGFRKYYLQELRKVTDYILAVVCGFLTYESIKELDELVDEIYIRENKGLLAGAWLAAIKHIGWEKLYEYDELLMLNDSFFGPFYPLKEMFDAMEASDADFYGVMKNYEEKDIRELGGQGLKGKWFKGSICYFYIIKKKLLHSQKFRKYWDRDVEIKGHWDTIFFAEVDFYEYLINSGFKIEAYQDDRLEGYLFDNLTHSMEKMVSEERIPFARARPFGTEMLNQSLQISYGQDPRRTMDFVSKNTDYDTSLIWNYLLRTKNMTHIWQQMQLEYVVSDKCVECEYVYDKPIAAIIHIYYEDQVKRIAEYCQGFPRNTKFYITTTKDATLRRIVEEFDCRKLEYVCQKRENVGAAMSTLWVTYADIILNGEYEYICYFHDKKSPYAKYRIVGEQFATRCYESLIGNQYIIKNVINLFENNPEVGMMGPPDVYHGDYFLSPRRTWEVNYDQTKELAEKLRLHVDISKDVVPVAPYGDMFWFRSKALAKAIGVGFSYTDFRVRHEMDATFLHAIERIYPFAIQDAGYCYATVINTDQARSDLVNYQYMIDTIGRSMIKAGNYPVSLDSMRVIAEASGISDHGIRMAIKRKVKERVPKEVWRILKQAYHAFGGRKWLG